MKKIYFLSLLALASLQLHAQPAFTTQQYPAAGAKDTFLTSTFPGFYATGIEQHTGNNYTWDFTSGFTYLPSGSVYLYDVPNPAQYLVFPTGADLRETSPTLSVDNLYNMTNDTLYMRRNGTSTTTGTILLPKLRWLSFPMSMNDSFYVSQVEYLDSAQTMAGFKRSHYYIYDGYGTVNLPWGSYPNTYRVRMVTRDSSYLAANYVITYSEYFWYRANGGMPVIRLTSTCGADSISHLYTVYANKSVSPTAVNNIAADKGISIYPNPASNTLFINNDNKARLSLTITDITGRKVLTQAVNNDKNTVPVSSLKEGTYFLSLTDSKGATVAHERFVKLQ